MPGASGGKRCGWEEWMGSGEVWDGMLGERDEGRDAGQKTQFQLHRMNSYIGWINSGNVMYRNVTIVNSTVYHRL